MCAAGLELRRQTQTNTVLLAPYLWNYEKDGEKRLRGQTERSFDMC